MEVEPSVNSRDEAAACGPPLCFQPVHKCLFKVHYCTIMVNERIMQFVRTGDGLYSNSGNIFLDIIRLSASANDKKLKIRDFLSRIPREVLPKEVPGYSTR